MMGSPASSLTEPLIEPYFQNLIAEFCFGAFSVVEGLGAAHWLAQNGQDGRNGPRINREAWLPAINAVYDENGAHGLGDAVAATLEVRDKLHQDRLGLREDIDWHAISSALTEIGYDGALVIESFTSENKTIATAASIWRPLAPSQDEIAVEGLAFLREL